MIRELSLFLMVASFIRYHSLQNRKINAVDAPRRAAVC